jgi:hypothetical protein
MFKKIKRKTDTIEDKKEIGFNEIWKRSMFITKFIFILICLYTTIATYMLLWALGIAGNVMPAEYDVIWISFSIVSFGMATLIAAYHLLTWILRQKRYADHYVIE